MSIITSYIVSQSTKKAYIIIVGRSACNASKVATRLAGQAEVVEASELCEFFFPPGDGLQILTMASPGLICGELGGTTAADPSAPAAFRRTCVFFFRSHTCDKSRQQKIEWLIAAFQRKEFV